MEKLFNLEPKKKKQRSALNDLQAAQLQDCTANGCTVKVHQVPKSLNKGFRDTPLFRENPPELF